MERKREESFDGISNLVESELIWRGAARLTQPPRPSNCSAQPLSIHLSGGSLSISIVCMYDCTIVQISPAGLARPQLRGRSEGDGVGGLQEVEGKDNDPWD